eukprot:TRINITY_DN5047_c0_g1_i1.p2 TRINITY_DN5047_c0_g1~~TRINITY_DN5047_c0_g1_i1.p2  ORF type:complete len:103 (+),score=7.79 TRINITY_DN5047_c0_g1_i1:261-569(+)
MERKCALLDVRESPYPSLLFSLSATITHVTATFVNFSPNRPLTFFFCRTDGTYDTSKANILSKTYDEFSVIPDATSLMALHQAKSQAASDEEPAQTLGKPTP